ncbi:MULTISPECIES: ribosome maturation factor RimP [Spiroplasma]|uniref:Ribosome maturation factor RimP n=1 Tax=Spiroplasma eriocheiris TaxID=315358 RepID=A0A0H3XJ36_9MOLU|nr:ribosome maturation factor [Spiroplasma eriocheiris]AHF58138.1 hypothetical protein SPE_1023 [Spiroplasma eriocheiris CCTCC M 207170]AKM54575.1 ribosome maturation factor RimP [Spiroplasma eriocheiris]
MKNWEQIKLTIIEQLKSYLEEQNLELFDIEYLKEFNSNVLRILIERKDGKIIDLDYLVEISEGINPLIDKLDLILEEYLLEISTPGAEKPLRNFAELARQLNQYLYLELKQPVNGLTEITGTLQAVDNNTQNITFQYFIKGVKKQLETNYQNINFARCAVKF